MPIAPLADEKQPSLNSITPPRWSAPPRPPADQIAPAGWYDPSRLQLGWSPTQPPLPSKNQRGLPLPHGCHRHRPRHPRGWFFSKRVRTDRSLSSRDRADRLVPGRPVLRYQHLQKEGGRLPSGCPIL